MKKFLSITAMALIAGSVFAGTPPLTFVRQINLPSALPNQSRMTAAISDSLGGVYYSNNSSNDNIWYMADPLTASVAGDVAVAVPGTLPNFGSGSFFGMTIDSNGTLFASGSDPNKSVLVSVTGSGPSGPWTPTLITLPPAFASGAGFIRLGGCTAVGPNKIVATGHSTGQLHFFTISAGVATLDGSVAAPAGFTGTAPDCTYDATSGKIFMSHFLLGTGNGGLYVFTSNGLPGGTAANVINPFAIDTPGQANATNVAYQSVSVLPSEQVVVTNRSNGAGGNGWQLFDASVTGPTTAYQFLTGGEAGGPGALASTDVAMGHTFFTKSGVRYFIGSNEDAVGTPTVGKFLVYQVPPASVSEWSMY